MTLPPLSVEHYVIVSTMLFVIGLWGVVVNRRQIIFMLLCMELALLAVLLNFAAFSHFRGDILGHIFGLFILTVAAAEAAIGLALVVALFRLGRGSTQVKDMRMLGEGIADKDSRKDKNGKDEEEP